MEATSVSFTRSHERATLNNHTGVATAKQLATQFSGRFRVLLIEKNSHFQHLFAFPRFAVTTNVDTHKAFIPFVPGTFADCPPGSGTVIRAKVAAVTKQSIKLDRDVDFQGSRTDTIDYAYLVVATGTKLTAPSTLPGSEKLDGVTYLRKHAETVVKSSNIVLIGAGAVGVQMAADIKELYPEKNVTLVHSRPHVMNRFHTGLDEIVKQRFEDLGINLKLGSRVKLPESGYPTDGKTFNVEFEDGSSIPADLAVICTGMTPQSEVVEGIAPRSIQKDKFITTRPTLQIASEDVHNVFVVGDIANTIAHKAARPGGKQAELVAKNIDHLEKQETLDPYEVADPPAIHLTLGLSKNVVFRNPARGSDQPTTRWAEDGRLDMGIDAVWARRGGGSDFHL